MVVHIVLVRCTADAPPGEVAAVFRDWPALRDCVRGVRRLTCGPNFGGELGAISNGWTHGCVAELEDRQAFAALLAHPDYQRLLGRLRPLIGGLLEVDYEVDKRIVDVVGTPHE